MGIFNGLFGDKKDKETQPEKKSHLNWIPLTDLQQIEALKKDSKKSAVLIFKHSTRCGISSMVIKQFEKLFTEEHKSLQVYYLDLLNYRDISNQLGETFQVVHQSPQLLVIKNEVCVFHTSHDEIASIDLLRFL